MHLTITGPNTPRKAFNFYKWGGCSFQYFVFFYSSSNYICLDLLHLNFNFSFQCLIYWFSTKAVFFEAVTII